LIYISKGKKRDNDYNVMVISKVYNPKQIIRTSISKADLGPRIAKLRKNQRLN
jgi:hypothetical protein